MQLCNVRVLGIWQNLEKLDPIPMWHRVSECVEDSPEIDLLNDDYLLILSTESQVFIGKSINGHPSFLPLGLEWQDLRLTAVDVQKIPLSPAENWSSWLKQNICQEGFDRILIKLCVKRGENNLLQWPEFAEIISLKN